MKYILILLTCQLTACGAMYNNSDSCQIWNKPTGYQQPNYCGASSTRATYVTRDNNGRVIAITRSQ